MSPTKAFFLSKKEYMDLSGDTRQNVWNKLKRGTLRTATMTREIDEEVIELSEAEYKRLLEMKQLGTVACVHDGE